MLAGDPAVLGLWMAVLASGVYHGLSPGMGWPLAVAAGLMEHRPRALVRALWPLALGHLLAVLVLVLPFALLMSLLAWHAEVQIGAGLLVIAFGLYRLVDRRHPRGLARIPPTALALWSFFVAIAHGSGLMLVPVYLGLCRAESALPGGQAAGDAMTANLTTALAVALVHGMAMMAAAGVVAWLVYRYLGLRFVSRSWFNLDATWAASLVLVGGVAVGLGMSHRG